MIFRQLFGPLSSTFTYLIGCPESRQALLIDPVYPSWERDLSEIRVLGLSLACTVETHVHAGHIASALRLKKETGRRIAFPAVDRLPCADLGIEEGRPLELGSIALDPIFTPGHTDDHFAHRWEHRLFIEHSPQG